MTGPERDTDDCGFLGGRLTLRQFRRGHRAGTDAVLLAAAAPVRAGQHLLDVGAGTGAAALAILARVPDATATLVERDGPTAALATHNLGANAVAARARVETVDLFDTEAAGPIVREGADIVVSNPPFYVASEVRASSDGHRRASHILVGHTHGEWVRRLAACLRPGGHLVIIHRPEVLPDLLTALAGRVGGVSVRPVHARQDRAAVRMLVTAQAGSRAPFALAPAVVLHREDGSFTELAAALHQGTATLPK